MQSKTNRKNPDRIILLEVGLILSLLFVNWALNLQYRTDTICIFDPPESLLYDPAYQYTEFVEPQVINEPELPKQELVEASFFDATAIIKIADDLFETKDEIITLPKFPNPGLMKQIIVPPKVEQPNQAITYADNMPEFPGGEKALNAFIDRNFKIPSRIYDFADDVTVVVEFVIDENGDVVDVQILSCNKPGFGIEREAKSMYANMPKWKAGIHQGEKAKVRMRQPIKIQINW
jgi:protein TonB